MCHIKGLGKDEIILNGRTVLCLAKSGGHIGFLEGWMANSFWFPKPAIEFLSYYKWFFKLMLKKKIYKLIKSCDFYGIDIGLNYR